ncbi:MAG: alpha-1,2-fucosyltransferase [Rubripirellula sp.]
MIVIARKTGRLGNRLKLFSHFIAFSVEHQIPIANPSFYKYAHLFRGTQHSDLWCRYLPGITDKPDATHQNAHSIAIPQWGRGVLYQSLHALLETSTAVGLTRWPMAIHSIELGQSCSINKDPFLSLAKQKNIWVRGYRYRCSDLVVKHVEKVRDFFQPTLLDQQRVDSVLDSARSQASMVVGVHIRHGDYKTYLDGKYYYPVSAYLAIMRQVTKLYPDQTIEFVVCSDAKFSTDDFSGVKVRISQESPQVDMYTLAGCDCLIGPPSSFTEWAAFYGGKPLYKIVDIEREVQTSDFEFRIKSMIA